MGKVERKLTSSQIIILGFLVVILLGTICLMTPLATKDGQGATFSDAIFTATSAVCVTGLVVQDTATYWSGFGQAIILLLIQTGGMGVVTIAVTMFLISGKQISLKQRSTMQEAISAHKVGGIVRLTGFLIRTTICIELAGALFMAPIFSKEFGEATGLWYALFHSVSAFCNAGFDLMGINTPYSSLMQYQSEPMINMTIMTLIVVGGIGFLTWEDIRINKLQLRKYKMQSKVILCTTGLLILIPALYFFFFEFTEGSMKERWLSSLFQSVTPRTAGFNTVDLTAISEPGIMIMILLMLIGGSPGSTAGGMKTTTFAVMISTATSVFQQKEHTHFFGRRIDDDVIRNASTILVMYMTLFLGGGLVISHVEGLPLLTCLFETASAVGTVGLTLGITPQLGQLSRWILILLMYLGRVGGLTLIFAAVSGTKGTTARLPQEKLVVG